MTWSPDSSTTGGTVTGFTTPTFTLVDDTAPTINGKQKAVSALGGTQGTASANTISKPFTVTFYKPQVPKALPPANPLSGLRGSIPNNQYKLIIRKGGYVDSGVPAVAVCRLTIDIPAGMDSYASDDVKSMISFLVGILNEESADLAETVLTGVL
jgi:hypothetical protein